MPAVNGPCRTSWRMKSAGPAFKDRLELGLAGEQLSHIRFGYLNELAGAIGPIRLNFRVDREWWT